MPRLQFLTCIQALTLVRAADRLEESNVPNSDDTGSGSLVKLAPARQPQFCHFSVNDCQILLSSIVINPPLIILSPAMF